MENNTTVDNMTIDSEDVGSLESEFGFTPEELDSTPETKFELAEEEQKEEAKSPDYYIPEAPSSPQINQEQSRHDEINEPAQMTEHGSENFREERQDEDSDKPQDKKPEAKTQEEIDLMILSERANSMIEYIQNRLSGETRADRVKQASIAITLILKAKTEGLNAMRQGRY